MSSLALGIIIGLAITWVLWPVQYNNADASDLRQSYKDDYIRMISAAYQADGDLGAARQRLSQLGLGDPVQTINDLIVRDKASRASAANLDALTSLAESISVQPASTGPDRTPSSLTPQAVVVVAATPTAPAPTFRLVEHTQLGCQDEPDAAYLIIIVRDASGHDVPNVGIQVSWSGGDDTVYTGLKPERGVGYADFEASPGTFSVSIINAQSDEVSDLVIGDAPADCKADHGATPRGWKLVFQQQ